MIPFRERFSINERIQERTRVTQTRPGYIATIFEQGSKDSPCIDKEKFMIPSDMNGAQLMFIIRRRIKMEPSQALFLFCKSKMITGSDVVCNIYERHKDPVDGFLYITYTSENTFG